MELHLNCPEHYSRFIELNERWIEHYFEIEPKDTELAEDPERVVRTGGVIITATKDGEVIGACALFHNDDGSYELARMAVDPGYQNEGIGRSLAEAIIEQAREKGAAELILLSNTVLESAIRLYERLGFRTAWEGEHPEYERCNIVMKLDL